MPFSFHDTVLDAALNVVKTATALHVVSGDPVDRAAVLVASLATIAVDGTDFTGPVDGSPNGRRVTVAAQNGVTVTATGTPAHYCLIDAANLIAKTEVDPASPGLTSGSTTNIPAVPFELADPVAL